MWFPYGNPPCIADSIFFKQRLPLEVGHDLVGQCRRWGGGNFNVCFQLKRAKLALGVSFTNFQLKWIVYFNFFNHGGCIKASNSPKVNTSFPNIKPLGFMFGGLQGHCNHSTEVKNDMSRKSSHNKR
jgi:hypothetical protein